MALLKITQQFLALVAGLGTVPLGYNIFTYRISINRA